MLTYTKNLIYYLQNQINSEHVFHIWIPEDFPAESNNNVILHKTEATYYSKLKRLYHDQFTLKNELIKYDIDVLFSSANYGIFNPPCPQILLIRNKLYYDDYYDKYVYSNFNIRKKIIFNLRKIHIYYSAINSDLLMFPSDSIKNSFMKRYNFDAKTKVNHYGTNLQKFKFKTNNSTDKLFKKFLYVSAYYTHKNPEIISKALYILNKNNDDEIKYNCKITMEIKDDKNIDNSVKEELINNPYINLGRVEYEKIASVYNNADLFIFPSFCESFGHPLIEAMASGLPIIAADTEINREICDNAAVYFNPFDEKDLANKILKLKKNIDFRNELIKNGKTQIKKYKWEFHVNKLLNIIEELYRTSNVNEG